MQFIITNTITQVVVGGADLLINPNLKKDLQEFFSVEVPGAFFARRKRPGWDGRHCFMNSAGEFSTGFLPSLLDHIAEDNYEITISDHRVNLPELLPKEKRTYTTPAFELFDHQKALVDSVDNYLVIPGSDRKLYFPRGVWKAATNAGKTAAFGCLIDNVVNPSGLICIDDQLVFEQLVEYYQSLFGKIGIVGKLGKTSYRQPGGVLTVAMVETLANMVERDLNVARWLKNEINILGFDECHTSSPSQAGVAIASNTDAGVRIGMSGTPFDSSNPMQSFKVLGLHGRTLHEVTKRYLMDNGFSLQADVRIYHNPTRQSGRDYKQQLKEVVQLSPQRAELIADMVVNEYAGKQVLITFVEKVHGKMMYDAILKKHKELAQHGITVDMVHGTDPDRSGKVQKFRAGEINVLLTSIILQQGVNIKNIEVIIFAQAGKSAVALSQFLGRGERLNEDATHFVWVDFYDEGKWVSKHSKDRMKFYKNELMPVTFMYKHNKGVPVK